MPKIHNDRPPTDRTEVSRETSPDPLAVFAGELDDEVPPAPVRRRPGRPKGSKNKPKSVVAVAGSAEASGASRG